MHSQKRYFITFIFYMYNWWDFLFTSINYPWFNTMKSTNLVEISAWLTNQLTQSGYYHLLYKGIWNKTHRLQAHTIHPLATIHIYHTLVSELNRLHIFLNCNDNFLSGISYPTNNFELSYLNRVNLWYPAFFSLLYQ